MSTKRDIRLQVALDFVELSRAIAVAELAIAGGADIIEFGGGNPNRPADVASRPPASQLPLSPRRVGR